MQPAQRGRYGTRWEGARREREAAEGVAALQILRLSPGFRAAACHICDKTKRPAGVQLHRCNVQARLIDSTVLVSHGLRTAASRERPLLHSLFYDLPMPAFTLLVTADPTNDHLKRLDRVPPGTRIIVSNDRERLRQAAPEADVILNADLRDPRLLADTFPYATRVQWVHTMAAGVESVLSPAIIASPVPFTNGRGVYRRPLGEWAVAAMLYFSYDLPRMLRNKEAERWEPFEVDQLFGHTLGIVGYGAIGQAIAERARPFGMRIVAMRRKPELSAGDPLVDEFYSPSQLNVMLAECDYVAASAPITPQTRGMIGKDQIDAMKSTAVIVNVGRGAVIDEPALIQALEANRIRGAGLDVFTTEPLPAGHPFYRLKNVLLSPHCADHTPGWLDRAIDFFLENFERFSKGEPLENVVDKHAGY
jgi:phosphoglycerate dehydrogenase-like enzyme